MYMYIFILRAYYFFFLPRESSVCASVDTATYLGGRVTPFSSFVFLIVCVCARAQTLLLGGHLSKKPLFLSINRVCMRA